MVGRAILSALSKEVPVTAQSGGEGGDPLRTLVREYPDLQHRVGGKRVLDFGCGGGDQAGALARRFGAEVTGLDINERSLEMARLRHGDCVRFVSSLPRGEVWDVVISQNAMEHYQDPADALREMRSAVAVKGVVLITFGPPWWAPYGSHMQFFCRLPWLQLWFSERTIMAVRAKYRSDGAKRFGEVESGLNKMSLAKFEQLIASAGLRVHRIEYTGVRGMHWITRIPLLRELGTVHVTSVLERTE